MLSQGQSGGARRFLRRGIIDGTPCVLWLRWAVISTDGISPVFAMRRNGCSLVAGPFGQYFSSKVRTCVQSMPKSVSPFNSFSISALKLPIDAPYNRGTIYCFITGSVSGEQPLPRTDR